MLKSLPALALVFAGVYVFRVDPDVWRRVYEPGWFALSILLLGLHFIIRGFLWFWILGRFKVRIGFPTALASVLTTALMRYIPGKVFSILGRAHVAAEAGGFPLSFCVFISTLSQGAMILGGFLWGVAGLLFYDVAGLSPVLYLFAPLFALGLLLLMFPLPIPAFLRRYVPSGARERLGERLPCLADFVLMIFLHWLVLGVAYGAFIRAAGVEVGALAVFFQPLANTIGIVAMFSPGGVGVREGVMVAYFKWGGIGTTEAVAVAVASRVWYLAGEVGAFAVGHLMTRRQRTKRSGPT